MKPDDDVCLCFHVSRRRIEKFIRLESPRRVSQLSECDGAGTGCGWCRPILAKLFENAGELPTLAEHAAGRAAYRDARA